MDDIYSLLILLTCAFEIQNMLIFLTPTPFLSDSNRMSSYLVSYPYTSSPGYNISTCFAACVTPERWWIWSSHRALCGNDELAQILFIFGSQKTPRIKRIDLIFCRERKPLIAESVLVWDLEICLSKLHRHTLSTFTISLRSALIQPLSNLHPTTNGATSFSQTNTSRKC